MKGILNARTADVFTVFPGHIISHSVEIKHANSEPIESSAKKPPSVDHCSEVLFIILISETLRTLSQSSLKNRWMSNPDKLWKITGRCLSVERLKLQLLWAGPR